MSDQSLKTNRYYQLHSKIYDLTRWSFLFGRQKAVQQIIETKPTTVLEIGCGTGRNILKLAQALPESTFYGLDASNDMLGVAQKKSKTNNIHWIQGHFPSPEIDQSFKQNKTQFDCILFSYALTMFNPGWDVALQASLKALRPNGVLILVDFDQSRHLWFKKWMRFNHVVMDGQLVDWLKNAKLDGNIKQKQAYGGIWQYFIYEGRKPA